MAEFIIHLRCSVEKSKGRFVLFILTIYIIAARNILLEVIMHHTRVVLDFQLAQLWDTKQQVLIVDI